MPAVVRGAGSVFAGVPRATPDGVSGNARPYIPGRRHREAMILRWRDHPRVAGLLLLAAGLGVRGAVEAPYVWRLPPGFPAPRVPADNPMSDAKVELGRHLF